MKIQVKHNLVIFRRPSEWETVSAQLVKTYGPSIMISWKTKRELGFTVRRHKGLVRYGEKYGEADSEWMEPELKNKFCYEDWICLDFYSEPALTYFLLKYAKPDTLDI